MPEISIIVPVYNAEKYLGECVESLLNQTVRDIEIILVDDGSPDNSPELCDEFAAKDSRVKVIHKKNAGAGLARNSGLGIANGRFVGFIDSDDYVDCHMYEELYDTAVSENADLVLSGMSHVGGVIYGNSKDIITRNYFKETTVMEGREAIDILLLGVAGALPNEPDDSRYDRSTCTNLFKKEIIDKNNITFVSERETMGEDGLFMIDYIKCINKAVALPKSYYYYRLNETSQSKSYNENMYKKGIRFVEETEKRLAARFSPEVYQIYTDRQRQASARVACVRAIIDTKANKLPASAYRKRLSGICGDASLQAVLKRYPWHKLPKMQAAFAFSIRYKLYGLQRLLVALREKRRKK